MDTAKAKDIKEKHFSKYGNESQLVLSNLVVATAIDQLTDQLEEIKLILQDSKITYDG